MNGADVQATGLGALLVMIGGVIAALAKGGWAVFRDWSSGSAAKRASTQTHSEKVTELAQEGVMALNASLAAERDKLLVRLATAEGKIATLDDELRVERAKSAGLADELTVVRRVAATLETTVGDLSSRLARLEGSNGAD